MGAVLAIVAIVAVAAIMLPRLAGDGGGLRALVHDSDGKVHELPLSRDAELVVSTSLGTNVIVVEDGAVFVRDADCGNHDCVRQGRIDAPGSQIICLPHELWIEVVSAGEAGGQMNVDSVPDSKGVDVTSR